MVLRKITDDELFGPLEPYELKCGLQSSTTGINWELVENIQSPAGTRDPES